MKEFLNSVLPIPVTYQLAVGFLATFVIACIGHAGRNYIKASEEFRNVIYSQLEGVYPNTTTYISTGEKNIRTQNSINPINTAGVKFQHVLPFFCVQCFIKTLAHYCETAHKTDWNNEALRGMYHSCADSGESPKVQFEKAIENMLKFAK